MEFNEEFVSEDLADASGDESHCHHFNFEAIDERIHPEASGPHATNAYREAGRAFIAFYDQSLGFILSYPDARLAAYVVAMASGRSLLTNGISQKELADRLGITRACVSKAVKNFQARFGNDIAGIEPMPGQRSMESCKNFSNVRKNQLTKK